MEPITVGNYSVPKKWFWWKTQWGEKKCRDACREIFKLFANRTWLKEMMKRLQKNAKFKEKKYVRSGEKYICIRRRSDIFYVPAKFRERFATLSNIFFKHGVFLEIAIPSMLRMLDKEAHFQRIPGVYLPGKAGSPRVDSKYLWTYYNTALGFIHPIKFNGGDKTLNLALFKKYIIPQSKLGLQCGV